MRGGTNEKNEEAFSNSVARDPSGLRKTKHTHNVALGLTSGEIVGPGEGTSDARGVGAWEIVGANEIVGLDDGGGEMVGFGEMVGTAEIWGKIVHTWSSRVVRTMRAGSEAKTLAA
jgi:hypothetical protein